MERRRREKLIRAEVEEEGGGGLLKERKRRSALAAVLGFFSAGLLFLPRKKILGVPGSVFLERKLFVKGWERDRV